MVKEMEWMNMTEQQRLCDLMDDIEHLRSRMQGHPAWVQLTYADQISDPSINETEMNVEEWDLDREGVVSRGTEE